ncbi:MAG: cation:proton antiporter [Ardenticatenia bacterium]|jgi:Kef-type K+ transport system membrane component KefB|nr:MAG: cation:proton antiporter [Ardenticatenia bacterium]
MAIPLLLGLAIVLIAAKVGGWLVRRLGQPAVLGELAVGLLLGPSVLNVFGMDYFKNAHTLDVLREFGELGVIFLMFAAGLEIQFGDLLRTGRAAVLVGFLGVVFPVGLGTLAGLEFHYPLTSAEFMGIVLAATSVSISARTLMELGRLRSREGLTLLSAAVVDDILAILVLSIFVGVVLGGGTQPWQLAWIAVRMFLFLAVAFLVGLWVLPRIVDWTRRLPISEPVLSVTVASVLLFAWAAEYLGGIAAITGAFVAGVGLARSTQRAEIERGIHALNYALFVPIFLVVIGLRADLRQLSGSDIGLTALLCLVAIVSKILGCGLGARLGGMSWRESLRVGTGMISRGEVGLIVAGVGLDAQLIQPNLFTNVVVMVIVTTLVTPPLLRFVFCWGEPRECLT